MARDTLVDTVAEAIRIEGARFTYHDDFLFTSAAEAAIDAIRAHLIAQAGQDVVTHVGDDHDIGNTEAVTMWQEPLADWLGRDLG